MLKLYLKKLNICAMTIFLIIFLHNHCLAATDIQEIIKNVQNTYEKQMELIDDYMVIQKPTGGLTTLAGETKVFYKKVKIDGAEVYKSRTETDVMGMSFISIYDGKYDWTINPITGEVEKELSEDNPSQFWKNLNSSNSIYLGEEMVGDEIAYVLQIENALQVLGNQMAQAATLQQNEIEKVSGKLWISGKDWMPLRMQMAINIGSADEDISINTIITTDFKDYRQVETMLHPFKLAVSTSTEIDTSMMSEEEKKEQEAAMMMMKSMMSGMGSFSIETVEVKVNTGLPDELFDGTGLK